MSSLSLLGPFLTVPILRSGLHHRHMETRGDCFPGRPEVQGTTSNTEVKLVSEADTSLHTQGLMAPSQHLREACWAGLLFPIYYR